MLIVSRTTDAEGDEVYHLSLRCAVCQKDAGLGEVYAVFGYPKVQQERVVVWAHKRCADGRLQELTGSRRAVLMYGPEALRRLVTHRRPPEYDGSQRDLFRVSTSVQ